jgi:hypothetical protein
LLSKPNLNASKTGMLEKISAISYAWGARVASGERPQVNLVIDVRGLVNLQIATTFVCMVQGYTSILNRFPRVYLESMPVICMTCALVVRSVDER